MTQDFDGPWKEVLDEAFPLFVALFFPNLSARIDWATDHVALESELQKSLPEALGGARRADRPRTRVSRGQDRGPHRGAANNPAPEVRP